MKIYTIIFDYSTDDTDGVDVELFDTYEKAVNRFNEIIENEKNPDMSWVGDILDENGNIPEDYEFDRSPDFDDGTEHVLWWNLTDKNNWYRHDFLNLRILEVK